MEEDFQEIRKAKSIIDIEDKCKMAMKMMNPIVLLILM